MKNIIEELIDEKSKGESIKDLELEASGKIQNYNLKLFLEKFDDDWKVYTTDIGFNIHSKIFGNNYHEAKECFDEFVKKYDLKVENNLKDNNSIFDRKMKDYSEKLSIEMIFLVMA